MERVTDRPRSIVYTATLSYKVETYCYHLNILSKIKMSPHKLVVEAEGLKIKIAIGKLKPPYVVAWPNLLTDLKDRGGTFTDCLGIIEGRKDDIVVKLLSQDPANYEDAPREGIRRILEQATGKSFSRLEKLSTSDFSNFSVRMGSKCAFHIILYFII